jgi:hypothetical protein
MTWNYSYTITGSSANGGTNATFFARKLDYSTGAIISTDPVVNQLGSGTKSGTGSVNAEAGFYWVLQTYLIWVDGQGQNQTQITGKIYIYPDNTSGTTAPGKKVTISLFNSKDIPVKYRVKQDGVVKGEYTLQPHTGLIQVVDVPSGSDVTVEALYEGVEWDGSAWVLQEGAVTVRSAYPVPGTEAGLKPSPSGAPTAVIKEPDDVPSAGPSSSTSSSNSESGSIWHADTASQTADLLTKQVYREGVDKIVRALNGDSVDPIPVPGAGTAIWQPTGEVNTKALGKLPTKPTFSGMTTVSAINVSLTIPKLHGGNIEFQKAIDFSQAPYAGPIAIFRTILLVLVTLVFFLATVYAVRGAFAGK